MTAVATPAPRTLALVGGTLVVTLFGVLAELAEGPHSTGLVVGALLAGVVAALSVGWAGRAPAVVGVVVVLASIAYHAIGAPGLAPAVAMYPAVYLLAASGTRWRLPLVAVLIVAVGVVPLVASNRPPDLGALAGPEVLMVAVAAMGEAARARRVAGEEAVRSAQATAAEHERRRLAEERLVIAREVHDVVAHTLSVVTVQAAAAADALDTRPDDTRAALAEVRRAARDATAELRGTLALLREGGSSPPGLASTPTPGLASTPGLADLPDLVARARSAGLTVTLRTGDPGARPPDVELAAYRIVQEALTNTLRHAGPTVATVAIGDADGAITVDVVDEGGSGGATTDPAAIASGSPSHGLVGMRERARAVGGTFEAGPTPEGGFRVAARLPARAPAPAVP